MIWSRTVVLLLMLLGMTPMLAWSSPEVPGAPQAGPVALVGATIHPIAGETIKDGIVLFDQGKIVAVGQQIALPEKVERIDLAGAHIYPGLFDAFTDMGLVEINSIRATIDHRETGALNPNVKSWVAVNPDSEVIPVTRSNGVLLTLSAPVGGLISGRSAVLQLDGWTYEDLTLQAEVGMHVEWPSLAERRDPESAGGTPPPPRTSPLQPLKEFWLGAEAYQKARAADPQRHPVDARFEAMLPVFDRKIPLIVTANELRQIQSAVSFAVEHNVRLIIRGGYDAEDCAELLKRHEVPVIVSGTYRLPMRASDPYDAPYTLPERLRRAGVKFCLASTGRFGASGVRNLPYHAATAVAFGLPANEALKAITLSPAEILGVSNRVGSIEPGKDATLFICSGDPLDTASQVTAAFIQGRRVDLSDRHKRLWNKYQEKYRQQDGTAKRDRS